MQVLELLQKHGHKVRVSGQDYLISCLNPEHEDNNPSMRIDKVSGIFNCLSCGFKGNLYKYYGVFTSYIPIRIAMLKEKISDLKKAAYGLEFPSGALPYSRVFRGLSVAILKKAEAFVTNQVPELADRICFPIRDITGKIQVFVCRHSLSNGNPRYLNYPSNIKMPLHPATISASAKSMILVEGILDLLMLQNHGLDNAVCVFGTKQLTEDNIKEKLLPYRIQGVSSIYILFDGDRAGEAAARELKPLISKEGFFVEIIQLADGDDPGSLSTEDILSIKQYIEDKDEESSHN